MARPLVAIALALAVGAAGPCAAAAAAEPAAPPPERDAWSRARPWLAAGLTGGAPLVLWSMTFQTMHLDPPAFYVAPGAMGLGHLLRGDLGRAAATSLGGPAAGLAGGAAGGLFALMLSPSNVGAVARYGYLAGATAFGAWATWDVYHRAEAEAIGAASLAAATLPPAPTQVPSAAGPPPDPRVAMAIPAGLALGLVVAAVPTNGLALVALPLTPGLGHVYAGEPVRGLLVTAGGPLAGAVGAAALSTVAVAANAGSPSGTPAMITALPIGFVLGYTAYTVWAVLDAGATASAKATPPAP